MQYNAIEVRGVVKQFGHICAVDHVDLAVNASELFGLIGHNGAGKTTLFKMLLGLLPASAGTLLVHGEPVYGPTFRQVRRHIGYLPESLVLYDNLSGLETLRFFAELKGVSTTTQAPLLALLERVGLLRAAHQRVRGYSKGMRQRLGFAQALLGNPKLLFLDEPTNGLDPTGIGEFYQILHELKAQGTTIILTSHILSEIQLRVDRLALMRSGKVQALGTLSTLREALHLPLDFTIRMHAEAEAALRVMLADKPITDMRADGLTLHLRCAREHKMQLLQQLAQSEGVADLSIQEPSLEDIFLGYSAA